MRRRDAAVVDRSLRLRARLRLLTRRSKDLIGTSFD